jgi:hypothetical protein
MESRRLALFASCTAALGIWAGSAQALPRADRAATAPEARSAVEMIAVRGRPVAMGHRFYGPRRGVVGVRHFGPRRVVYAGRFYRPRAVYWRPGRFYAARWYRPRVAYWGPPRYRWWRPAAAAGWWWGYRPWYRGYSSWYYRPRVAYWGPRYYRSSWGWRCF